MKTFVLSLLFFTVLLSSCNKSKISLKDETAMIGEYEWAYSFGADNESESQETISDRYGIVLKKNGKAKLYHNSELVSSGYVVEVNPSLGSVKEVLLVLDDENVFLTFTGTELEYDSYPIENHTNIFKKQ